MIICFETGQSFKSISEAKKTFTKGNINYALKTGGGRGGYHFMKEVILIKKKTNTALGRIIGDQEK